VIGHSHDGGVGSSADRNPALVTKPSLSVRGVPIEWTSFS